MQILKLKDGVDVESLRKYGFKTGKEWAAQGERCFLPEVGMSYQYEWFHVFAMDEEEPEKIAYTSDEFSIPRMQLYVRDRHVCCSCSVEGTYHIDKSKINWKVRIKNKAFWLALIPAVLLLIQVIASVFGYTLDLGDLGNKLLSVVEALFMVLSILGIVVDPTTDGVGDSKQALTYTEPKK